MRIYYKSKSKSIFYETASSGGAKDESTTLAVSGTRVCLRSFDLASGAATHTNTSIKQSTPAYVYFEKMDASNTEILQMPITCGGSGAVFDLGGGALVPSGLITIPGPGILSDDGMRVRVTIPANGGNGPIFALVNVVYSV